MRPLKTSEVAFITIWALYCVTSKLVFDQVYLTSKVVIDEEFHLSQGKAYCRYEFNKWHPKITTFPGLYLLSTVLLGGFNLCAIYWLRLVPLACSFLNLYLFYRLLNLYNDDGQWRNLLSALNLALLPPLYFFSHLYYTDTSSLTMILLMCLSSAKNQHFLASLCGSLAVLFRQTNIIWVATIFGAYALRELNATQLKKHFKQHVTSQELRQLLKALTGRQLFVIVRRAPLHFYLNCLSYGCLFLSFFMFILLNGSIVVGDKSAHAATLHLPQLFYFALFTLFFGWPHFIPEVVNLFNFVKTRKRLVALTSLICLAVVHFNTVVHPYLLADNRHYTFYVWNRFYAKYALFRYAMVPIYLFALYVMVKKMWNNKDVTFAVAFIPCTVAVLITAKLLEIRYFLVPYVLFRMQIRNAPVHYLLYEFMTHCLVNTVTLQIFFSKSISWPDYDYYQRLIW